MRTLHRTVLALVIHSLAVTGNTAAQTPAGNQASIDDLKAPPSPAFVLLGTAPTKVERPQAVRPLVLSAISAVGNDGLPRNYAVEFAPYWLVTPEISFDQYYRPGLRALSQHLSVSVATIPLPASLGPGTALGMGARTLPVPGRPHPQLVALRGQLVTAQRALNRILGTTARRPRLIALFRGAAAASTAAIASELATKPIDDLVERMIDLDLQVTKLEIERDLVLETLEELEGLPDTDRTAKE